MIRRLDLIRVKICCIQSAAEAEMAIRYGASAVGLVSEMPSGFGPIAETRITEITRTFPPAVGSFLLTSKDNAADIIAQQRRCGVNTIQICDRLPHEAYGTLREALPGISIVQVLHVRGESVVEEARDVDRFVDAILLDSGDPEARVKRLGGTGETHNWAISRRVRDEVKAPVFLAGGLRPENVGRAIRTVRPFGVDVCTGVRTRGRLEEGKLAAFFDAVRSVT